MQDKQHTSEDSRCPKGYRHLVSLIDATSPLDARLELIAMFGQTKASAAVIKQGHNRPKEWGLYGVKRVDWVFNKAGYTAFIPKGFKS